MTSGRRGSDYSLPPEFGRRPSVVDDSEAGRNFPDDPEWWESGREYSLLDRFRDKYPARCSLTDGKQLSPSAAADKGPRCEEQLPQTLSASTHAGSDAKGAQGQTLLHVNASGTLARSDSGTLTWTAVGGGQAGGALKPVDAEPPVAVPGWAGTSVAEAEQSFTSATRQHQVEPRIASSSSHASQTFDALSFLERHFCPSPVTRSSEGAAAASAVTYRAVPASASLHMTTRFHDLLPEMSAFSEADPIAPGPNVAPSDLLSPLQTDVLSTQPSSGTTLRLEPQRCQIQSCLAELTHSKPYCRRYKLCEGCIRSDSVLVRNVEMRFCQQCR